MFQASFLDPQLTEDGRPYAPARLKQIIRERYEISKRIHTSYNDLGKLTPLERNYLLEFILEDNKRQEQQIEDAKRKIRA